MNGKLATFLVLSGAVFMSFNGLIIRLVDSANGFQILFFRSISMSILLIIVIMFKRQMTARNIFSVADRWDFIIGICLGLAFTSYVFSILYSSVASTLFILSTSPIIATILAWLLLNEKPSVIAIISMFLSITGVFLMVTEGLVLDKTIGNSLSFLAALSFAGMLVVSRLSKKADILTGTFLGGGLSGIIGMSGALFVFQEGLMVGLYDLVLIFCMGAFAIGLGITLVSLAAPFLPSSEISILVLLESFLGPIWVWIFLGESMSKYEIVGGSLIFLSVSLLSYYSKNDAR